MSPWQPIKLSNFDKCHMKHGELLNKYFCKKNKLENIPNEAAEIAIFHFFHYKSMILDFDHLLPLVGAKSSGTCG